MIAFTEHRIKPETIELTLNHIANNKVTTRKHISDSLDISIVTAGKAVDLLSDLRIVQERRSSKKVSGPHPREIFLNRRYNCTVLDLRSRNFSAVIYDIYGKELTSVKHKYDRRLFIDDNFNRFLRLLNNTAAQYNPEYSIGTGVIIPSEGENKDFLSDSSLRPRVIDIVRKMIDKRLSPKRIIFDTNKKCTESYLNSSEICLQYDSVIYVCINKSSFTSEVILNGNTVNTSSGRIDILNCIIPGGKNIRYLFNKAANSDEADVAIAYALGNAIMLFSPKCIIFDSEDYNYISGAAELIKNILVTKLRFKLEALPLFIYRSNKEARFSNQGMVHMLRHSFIKDVVKKLSV